MVIIVYSQGFSLLIMPISIMRWHVEIGMFNPTHKTRFIELKSLRLVGLSSGFLLGICFVLVFLMLFACGDIELKDALSGLRQFLVTESPLAMMKNAFYLTSKVLFVLKIFKFLS